MRVRWLLLFVMAVTVLGSAGMPQIQAAPAGPAASLAATCSESLRPSGSVWKICFPTAPVPWNGDLVV